MQMNVLRTKQVSHVGNRDDHGQPIAGGNGQRIVYVYRMKANLMNCEYLSDLFHKVHKMCKLFGLVIKSGVCAVHTQLPSGENGCEYF